MHTRRQKKVLILSVFMTKPSIRYYFYKRLPHLQCVPRILHKKGCFLKVSGFQVFLEPGVWVPCLVSVHLGDLDVWFLVWSGLVHLDDLDCEEKAGNFSFYPHWIPIVELPLQVVFS